MSFYRGMTCENVTLKGDGGTPITAYTARPEGKGPFPGVVLIHHLPGWSEFYIETTRRFAHHGYLAICANLYQRSGDGNPDDVAAKVRAEAKIERAQTPAYQVRLDQPIGPIAHSAAELLTGIQFRGQVRRCEGHNCGWLFVDSSKNHSRRWCDMRDCGNRAKVRRHRLKMKSQA